MDAVASFVAQLLNGLAGASSLFLVAARPLRLDDKARKLMDAEAHAILAALKSRFASVEDWTAASLEALVRNYAEETGIKLGKVAQPLRSALTGRTVSPPVFDVMAVLGREETLLRLTDQTAAPA